MTKMRRPIICRMLPWLLIGFASLMVIIALFAGYLGADADKEWGPLRIWILIIGLVGILFPIALKIVESIDRRLVANQWSLNLRPNFKIKFKWLPARFFSFSSNAVRRRGITLLVLFIAVELLYIWFVSVGHMTTWPSTSNVYNMLAESFEQGQAALLIEPDPQLQELENPYPTSERPGIQVVRDASYFQGKYYIYWGPVPAVIVALWRILTSQSVGDEQVVFIAVSLIFLFSMLILLNLRRNYFPLLPGWMLAVGIIIIATAHPMLWVLNWPTIYPAAIASGQAFLLAGLFFALPVIEGSQTQSWRLALTGVLWACALGSRLLLVGAIGLLTLATVISLSSAKNDKRQIFEGMKKSTMLIVPLVVGIVLIGFYNYVRFGNLMETGFRYMMSRNDLPRMLESGLVFNPIYLLPNLFYLLIAPLQFRTMFPVIRPLWQELSAVSNFLARFNIPDEYHIEDITGVLVAMPTLIFVGFLVWELLCNWRIRTTDEERIHEEEITPKGILGFRRTIWIILLAAILAAIPMFFFFWVATRYLLDGVPLFAILAAVGVWLLYKSSRGYPLRGPLSVLFIFVILVAATLVSFLLAISGADSRFDDLNPVLFEKLSNLFSLKQ